jgi:hypothetical protein
VLISPNDSQYCRKLDYLRIKQAETCIVVNIAATDTAAKIFAPQQPGRQLVGEQA